MRTQPDQRISLGCVVIAWLGYGSVLALVAAFGGGCRQPGPIPTLPDQTAPAADMVAQAEQIIRDGLTDQNPQIRVNAIEVVAVTKKVKLMPKVQRMLRDQLVPVRFAAALAVGDLQYSLAKADAAKLLNDPDENVRVAAAYAAYRLGSTESFELLRKALADKNQTVRANAVFVLGKTGDQRALSLLYIALTMRDSDDKVRYQAVDSIARLGDEHIFEKIWTMLISVYADVRVTGIQAMGNLGTSRARDSLLNMLDDDVPEVRLAAAEQLGKLGDKSGQNVVLDVFRKNFTAGMSIEARERIDVFTALAIGQICTDRVRKFLPQLLRNRSKRVRLAAAKAVFQCINQKRLRRTYSYAG